MRTIKPQEDHLGKNSPAKKKLLSLIHKQYPELNEKETSNVLSNIKKLVTVVKRIQTEPQAQIIYKEEKRKGTVYKTRTIVTDIEEFGKVLDNGRAMPIQEAVRKLSSYFPEKQHGKRSK